MKFRDRLWLWGQNAGSHHHAAGNQRWKLPGENRMEPLEGAQFLGIPNMCRVVMCNLPAPPFDDEAERLRPMRRVMWSAIGDSGSVRNDDTTDLGEVLRLAEKFPNLTGAILDDFFRSPVAPKPARLSLAAVQAMAAELHACPARRLDFSVVFYKRQLAMAVDDYLHCFDIVTYWNMMAPAEIADLDRDFAAVVARTPGQRRMNGCYLWNYGEGKPLTREQIETECETYRRHILEGTSEGIIFCSNCCADLGAEAVDFVRAWIEQHAEDEC